VDGVDRRKARFPCLEGKKVVSDLSGQWREQEGRREAPLLRTAAPLYFGVALGQRPFDPCSVGARAMIG